MDNQEPRDEATEERHKQTSKDFYDLVSPLTDALQAKGVGAIVLIAVPVPDGTETMFFSNVENDVGITLMKSVLINLEKKCDSLQERNDTQSKLII